MDTFVTQVTVQTDESGDVVVDWQIEGPDVGVDIAHGATPEAIDHTRARTVVAGSSSAHLGRLAPDQRYISVAPHGGGSAVVAAERRLRFEGVENFRDLGGYPTAGGGRTRWGLVFRADALHTLTAADHARFHQLGLRVVYDLRSDSERASHPDPVDTIQLAIVGRPPAADGSRADRNILLAATDGEAMLRDLYIGMLVHSATLFGRLFAGLVDGDGLPAVFHCHAGKDRTGLTAALLLLALGVARDDVLDDYELTRRYRTVGHQQGTLANLLALGMAPEAAAGVLAAPRWAMADALDAVDGTHGGIASYLTGPAGLSAAQLRGLRAALVTAPAAR